jgi:hypothetical protein
MRNKYSYMRVNICLLHQHEEGVYNEYTYMCVYNSMRKGCT